MNAKGQTIDCVAFTEEMGVRTLLETGVSLDTILAPFQSADQRTAGPSAARECTEMTVPHVRLDAGQIGALQARRPLQPDSNTVVGVPLRNNDSIQPPYGHVEALQQVSEGVAGGAATLSVGAAQSTDFWINGINHVVGQVWVGSDSTNWQTVEVGWKITNGATAENPPPTPYLFVGGTQDNYRDFCENGFKVGATKTCLPWVPNPNATAHPGMALDYSTIGGTQVELMINVQRQCVPVSGSSPYCTWGIVTGYAGVASQLGYFAASGYGTGPLGVGLGSAFIVGGEVSDSNNTAVSSTPFADVQMGEAPIGVASYSKTAYVRDFGYYGAACNPKMVGSCWPYICFARPPFGGCTSSFSQAGAVVYTTRPEFTYSTTAAPGAASWSNWFYYGDFQIVKIHF